MWRLTIEDDEGNPTSLPLPHDGYDIGRDEASAIRLTDRNVSRKHARVERVGDAWRVLDLVSYNGTFINGMRVAEEQLIQHGDIVQVGEYRLLFSDETASVGSDSGESSAEITQPVPFHQRPDRLVVIVGPHPGTEFPLEKEKLTIGRAEDCDVSINHSSVSRVHAELQLIETGRFEVIDKGSANGIRINGVDARQGFLEPGDSLELGDVRLRYVEAGRIFRADADVSSPNRVATGFESGAREATARPSPISSRRPLMLAILILVAAGALAAGIYRLRSNRDTEPVPRTAPSSATEGLTTLSKAELLSRSGDHTGAHALLQAIPETSPDRRSEAFAQIEALWARDMLQRAEAADPSDRRRILEQLAATPTLDASTRKLAADELARDQAAQAVPAAARAKTGGTSEAASEVTPTPSQAPIAIDYAAERAKLQAIVFGGNPTPTQVRMLMAVCRHLEDQACVSRASAVLNPAPTNAAPASTPAPKASKPAAPSTTTSAKPKPTSDIPADL